MIGRKPTVLVVDDERDIREFYGAMLDGSGYSALSAANGADALDLLAGTHIDAVLLDINMPGMDGHETLARMLLALPGLPVLMLTAVDSKAQRSRALEAGAADYLVKPHSAASLLDSLERAIALCEHRPRR